jgi:glutaredoxin
MDSCPYCNELKELLNNDNIKFIEVDINDEDNKDERDMIFKVSNSESVPIIRVGNQLLAPDVSFTSIKDAFELVKRFM